MNGIPPVAYPQPPKRTGWIVYSVIVTFFLLMSVLANFALLGLLVSAGGRAGIEGRRASYEEEFMQGDTDTRNKVVVIYLTGVITSDTDGAASVEGMVGDIKDQLAQAVDDKRVKAIILRINSPGGEVVASDTIYQAVLEARKSKPIVVSMETVGASGAYYVAMGANYVMATDLTITGSIGVILQSFSVQNLMNKIGVQAYTFKSGNLKDILNPTREPTDEEKKLVTDLIMEVYGKFVGIVAKSRNIDVEELKSGLADGRILSGQQAKEANLIDGLGYFDDAVQKAKELAKIERAKVVRYTLPFSLRNLARLLGSNDRAKIQVNIAPTGPKLESGKLYFLPAYMFQ
ncbi:MAG TPA: signal peptide peptidase SppA [Verrucomicrobiae bacterium]|nr:signal peptide peptidase SppA [Verrucomicrobiae bacterium]